MSVTQEAQALVADRAGETLSTGARVSVFAGSDRATTGTLVEDFGDVLDAADDSSGNGVDAPRRFAIHTDDGMLVFADSGDVEILDQSDEPEGAGE